jgi:outer membrane protein assembly factor BamB
MVRWLLLVLLVPTFVGAQSSRPRAGAQLPGETAEPPRTLRRIDDARLLVQKERWADALDEYQRLLEEVGDDLVPLTPERRTWAPARWLCHADLASLPTAALATYRQRVDGAAQRRLQLALAKRDLAALERLVEENFCSSACETALDVLGDLSCERGEFVRALHFWQLLVNAAPTALRYPAPTQAPAPVWAKLGLAAHYAGQRAPAEAALAHLRKHFPTATGRLADRTGPLADSLAAVLQTPVPTWPSPVGGGWTSLAGSPERGTALTQNLPVYWPFTPTWETPLHDTPPRPGIPAAAPGRGYAFHPVLLDGRVLVADAARVLTLDGRTGRSDVVFDLRKSGNQPPRLDLTLPTPLDVHYSLTTANGRVFARLGTHAIRPARPNANREEIADADSYLVCLAPRRTDGRLTFRWQLRPSLLDKHPAIFEGAPVVRGGLLYVVVTRFEESRVVTSMNCYDGADYDGPDATFVPRLRWRTDLCETNGALAAGPRYRHDLLTLAGTQVVYLTQEGLVVAVDGRTGRRTWAVRYPQRSERPGPVLAPRAPAPCLAHGGRLYAAPIDAERIYCWDTQTGAEVWASQPVEVADVIGLVRDRLVVTTQGQVRGARAYDLRTGAPVWTQHDDGGVASAGRGFVTNELFFWPTRAGLRILRLDTGDAVFAVPQLAGNLAYAEGLLVVTTPTSVQGIVSERLRLLERAAAAHQQPHDAETQYRLGLALADTGQTTAAVRAFTTAQQLAGRSERVRGWPLTQLVQLRLHEIQPPAPSASPIRAGTDRFAPLRQRLAAGGAPAPLWQELAAAYNQAGFADASAAAAERARQETPGAGFAGLTTGTERSPAPQPRSPPPLPAVPALPWRRVWEVPTPAGALVLPALLPQTAQQVYLASTQQVSAYALATGACVWQVPVTHEPTHATEWADTVILSGPTGIVRLRRSDGAELWQQTPPTPTSAVRLLDPPAPEPYAQVVWAGTRLLTVQSATLSAVDVETGHTLWRQSARALGGTALDPQVYASAGAVLVRVEPSGRTIVDARTGTPLHTRPTASRSWASSPTRIDERWAVVADGPGTVTAVDVFTSQERWRSDLGRTVSLAGPPPAVCSVGSHVLVRAERNLGVEIERLNLTTGRPLAGPPLVLDEPAPALTACGTDADTLYVPAVGALLAVRLGDGQTRWRTPLPVGYPWRVQATAQTLLTWPTRAPTVQPVPAFERALSWRWPEWFERRFTLLAVDPLTGRVLQAVQVPTHGPQVGVVLTPQRVVVATAGRLRAWAGE